MFSYLWLRHDVVCMHWSLLTFNVLQLDSGSAPGRGGAFEGTLKGRLGIFSVALIKQLSYSSLLEKMYNPALILNQFSTSAIKTLLKKLSQYTCKYYKYISFFLHRYKTVLNIFTTYFDWNTVKQTVLGWQLRIIPLTTSTS